MPFLNWIRGIFDECIEHEHEQVGRCVYCRQCGRRLYQGTVMTKEEIGAIKVDQGVY